VPDRFRGDKTVGVSQDVDAKLNSDDHVWTVQSVLVDTALSLDSCRDGGKKSGTEIIDTEIFRDGHSWTAGRDCTDVITAGMQSLSDGTCHSSSSTSSQPLETGSDAFTSCASSAETATFFDTGPTS